MEGPVELTIDRTTPIQRPSDDQVRQWAQGKRIFISSTMDDLADERQIVAETISAIGAHPVMFETFGARSDDSRQAYLAEVRRSDIYLGILSRQYGVKQPSGYSATHAEYEEAKVHRKELLFFLDASVPDKERDGHLNTWLRELYQLHVLAKYRDADELARQVRGSLETLAQDQLTPWVKLGGIIFQATHIKQRSEAQGTAIEVTTASRDPHVRSQLAGLMKSQSFGQARQTLTFLNRSFEVEVFNIEEQFDPLSQDSLQLSCRTDSRPHGRQHSHLMMLGGGIQRGSQRYGQDDLIRLALRNVALAEPLPDMLRGFVQETTLPLKSLYEVYGDDMHVFSKIVHLLIVETVFQHGIVDRLVSVHVERVGQDRLHVSLVAVLPQPHASGTKKTVEVDGEVALQ